MKVVKEEVEATTQEKNVPYSMKELTDYKKKLRSEVELLELEARHVKARLDYIVYTSQLTKYEMELAKLQEQDKAESPTPSAPVEKSIVKNLK